MNDVPDVISAPRTLTGIAGLDDVLGGGLPQSRMYLVQGDPGVGKTTLSLQFLLEGRRQNETVMYITLSETRDEIEAVAASHGWSLDGVEILDLSVMQEIVQNETENTFFRPAHVELNRVSSTLTQEVIKTDPHRLVIDSLSEMRMLAETPLRFRRQILGLKQFFAGRKCTVLLLDDRTAGSHDLQVESIAHGVIDLLSLSPEYGILRRQLSVRKIRGARFREGFHDINIQTGGMVVYPRLIAAEHHREFLRSAFPSNVEKLDLLLGGGLDRGTSNMFMGPPGSGKSTLAIKFMHAAALRGEKTYYLIFDETLGTFMHRANSLGMDLQPFVDSGVVRLEQIDPAEIAPGEMAHRIRTAVKDDGIHAVVIDSINGYLNAMPAERYLNLQLHELLSYLNQQGVTSIMILAQQGVFGALTAKADLTYLADTVLMLRYFEMEGAVRQSVSVIKKRSGNHERTIREIRISANGFEVSDPITTLSGVLTGVPTFSTEKREESPSLDARLE